MDAKYLDFILEVLKAKHPQSMLYTDFVCTAKVNSVHESKARALLVERNFIFDVANAYSYIGITGQGLLFLQQGGFQKEEELRNAPIDANRIAKQSKRIAVAAIIISIIAIAAQIFWK